METSYSKSVQFGPINSTVESNSSFVEEKEFNKIGSLAEPNYSTLKSSDCLNFEKSDLDIVHSNVDLNFFDISQRKYQELSIQLLFAH